jgi:hypothetical protein
MSSSKDDGRYDVRFTNVNANDITDNLTIRFASVNGEDAVTAAQKGVLQIKSMPKSEFDYDDQYTFAFGEIKKYKGTNKDIVIPNAIWDNPVISIGERAFSSKSLTDVTIPDGVTYIGRQAFAYNNLTSITIGKNVTLDEKAFGNGFEEAYKSRGRMAGTYNSLKTDNSDVVWRKNMTDEEREQARQRQEQGRMKKLQLMAENKKTGIQSVYFGGGSLLMLHQDSVPIYIPSFTLLNGQFVFGLAYIFGGVDFFNIGMNIEWGPMRRPIGHLDDAERIWGEIKKNYPDIPREDIEIISNGSNKVNFFARLYLSGRTYLTGGGGWWWHAVSVKEKSEWNLERTPLVSFNAAPVYTAGIGFILWGDKTGGFFLESNYNMLPNNNGLDGYLTINAGISLGGRYGFAKGLETVSD